MRKDTNKRADYLTHRLRLKSALTGRIIQSKSILTTDNIVTFYLEIDNGVYFIAIRNPDNEVVVKKIHIAK
jgi:hypothetical protein